MRTALYVFGASLSLYAPLQSVAAAPVFSSLLSNMMPHSRAARHLDAHSHAHEARGLVTSLDDDTVLESLRILPDDDDDGLLDLEGRLKVLKDGEVLDLEGIVSVGNVLDACVEVNVGGRLTKRCHDRNSNKKHYRDTWTKEEHRRCSKHFKEWHHKHGHGGSCGDKLEAALRRISELERQLRDCNGESTAPRRPKNVLAVRPRPNKSTNWSDPNDGRSWHDKVMEVRPSRDNDDDRDDGDREEQHRPSPRPTPTHRRPHHDSNGEGCDGILKEHVDENGVHAKVCVSAGVSVAGVQATASASATVDVDLARGQASAEATATVGANVGSVVSVGAKASATASVDLKKGEAEVKVNTDETLKLGNKKVLDTGIDAQVAVNKKCGKGEVLDLAGICVAVKTDDKKSGSSDNGSPASSILNNVLGGVRVL